MKSVVNKIEHGTAIPSIETFISPALVLNLSTAALLRKMGVLPELPASQASFEQWKHLLDQMKPTDEEELRLIAETKLERYKNYR